MNYECNNNIFFNLKQDIKNASTDYDKSQLYLKLLYLVYANNYNLEEKSAEIERNIYFLLEELFSSEPKRMDVMSADDLSLTFDTFHRRILANDGDKKKRTV